VQGSDDTILLYGAAGHAKSVIGVLESECKWRLVGLVEDGGHGPGATILGYPILGDRSSLPTLRQSGVARALVAVGDNAVRLHLAEVLRKAGFLLTTVMHPSAYVMKDASIGEGSFAHAYAVIGPECRVGANAIISSMASVGHESVLGECVHLTPGVRVGGKVRIGALSFLGMGAVVFPGICIGRNVRVAANTVVNRDLPDDVIVAGMPARIVKKA
jgi:sugar O-acyltransferase (sialic acid O-acetyltransferase NeuD family)